MKHLILALYLRLSRDDDDAGDESNSISNQRLIIQGFLKGKPEFSDYQIQEYVDDGYSGKHYDRPGIKRLLNDVRAGKVYGILVKDISRFGRNHIENGDYIEKIFPLLNVRFIAINNEYDSKNGLGLTPEPGVTFENLIYDFYSEDTSKKVKHALLVRRQSGKYLAAFAAFGYEKDKRDHNHLVIDQKAAAVVAFIFSKYAETKVKAEVARILNEEGIPTPQEYMNLKGLHYSWRYKETEKLWTGSIVGKILRNQTYAGNSVVRKTEVSKVGTDIRKRIPRDEWQIVPNTHEAIISKELFEMVNQPEFGLYKANKKVSHVNDTVYCEGIKRKRSVGISPIKGLVKCGGCRHHMQRRDRMNASYYCRFYYELHHQSCYQGGISESQLIELVLTAVRNWIDTIADVKQLYDLQYEMEKQRYQKIEQYIKNTNVKISQLQRENFLLYEKYTDGSIDKEKYLSEKGRNQKTVELLQKELKNNELRMMEPKVPEHKIFTLIDGIETVQVLTRELAEQLISDIYVYNDQRVEVMFRFQDELDGLRESGNYDNRQTLFDKYKSCH